jgi:amidase
MTSVTPDLIRLYADSDALGLAERVRRREVTPAELVETAISVIETLDPQLNAVVIRTFDMARAAAAETPPAGAFAGVPFLLKNIGSMWKGTRLTAGLRYLEDFVCDIDSDLSSRIKEAGFLLLGRTNTPEGGWCIATEPRLYGPTLNPWNTGVTPGGSSGGAAAAVASRMVPLAEASDGGGSIRVPASCCGLVGLKPSRGRITYGPRDVDVWLGSVYTFCVTRTVRDTAAFLDATAGNAVGDPYTAPTPDRSWLAMLDDAPRPLRIGFTVAPGWGEALAPEVRDAVLATVAACEAMGHTVEEHRLGVDLEAAWWAYNTMNAVETAADFDRLAAIVGRPVSQDDLSPFNAALLAYGQRATGVDYAAAIAQDLDRFDVFLTPTLTQPARPVGYWSMEDGDRERYLDRWSDAAYMFAFNLSGLPALSLPAAMDGRGVPIGVQMVGRHGDEACVLRLARQLETARPWAQHRPPICAGTA